MGWILEAFGEWMMGEALAVEFSGGTSEHWPTAARAASRVHSDT